MKQITTLMELAEARESGKEIISVDHDHGYTVSLVNSLEVQIHERRIFIKPEEITLDIWRFENNKSTDSYHKQNQGPGILGWHRVGKVTGTVEDI